MAAGFDGVFDWDFLLPAFEGTKITPMDFDCVVERRGNFLVIETKELGKDIPRGQIITLESLVETRFAHVITLQAKVADDISGWEVWYWGPASRSVCKQTFEGSAEDLTVHIGRWFDWATNNPVYGAYQWRAEAQRVTFPDFPHQKTCGDSEK